MNTCRLYTKVMYELTQQVGSFVHIADEPRARRRQLLKQGLCVAVERHVLNALGGSAEATTGGGDDDDDSPSDDTQVMMTILTQCTLYLQGLYPMRSMSSSGVDSMMFCTSELSSFSGKPETQL